MGHFRTTALGRWAMILAGAALISARAWAAVVTSIVAEAMPDPQVPGFQFPESEATITNWIAEMTHGSSDEIARSAFEKVQLHGWGLWTALTTETAQIYGRQKLRVFETWFTPQELSDQAATRTASALAPRLRGRAELQDLHQFQHGGTARAAAAAAAETNQGDRVMGFVKFDPTAADHILKQGLLTTTALNQLLQGGASQIPVFPATALALKPVFQVIKAKDLVEDRYYLLKTWRGPPDLAQSWGPAKWTGAVWIDLLGGGSGQGAVDAQAAVDGSTRTEATTYPVSSLINFQLSAADAAALNLGAADGDYSSGDTAIMVAMHVAGREIVRWTWQTFWWTPAPDDPPAPSSRVMAELRPAQLQGAPRHYAMSLCYSLLAPDQPFVGGENAGPSVYAYNPWLEAHFAPADLPDSQPGLDPTGRPADNNTGVQTNCMSCHLRANYNPQHLATAPRYAGARYVDLMDPQFVGTLQVDFLWSIPANAH